MEEKKLTGIPSIDYKVNKERVFRGIYVYSNSEYLSSKD